MMKDRDIKFWMTPLLTLFGASLVLCALTFFIDKQLNGAWINQHLLGNLFSKDAGTLANVLGGLTQVAPAILGIAITVIAIIVEMASNKYSPKVMDLFVHDNVNFWVISLFVVTSVFSIWVAHILTDTFFPIVSIIINGILVTTSLLLVIPYFNFVFNFLHPNSFIDYVKNGTIKEFPGLEGENKEFAEIMKIRETIHGNIDFIGDIAINAVTEGDRAVSQFSCSKLKDITLQYLEIKKSLPEHTFTLTDMEYLDPDFIDFSDYVMNCIEKKHLWLERKILRLFEIVFTIARENLRTTASSVLLNTLQIGEKAIVTKDRDVIFTVMQYFNTFLRFSINSNDPRSAFNILEHYRAFGESLMEDFPDEVENVAFYIKVYAHEAQKRSVLFILETAAHDICRINEIAFQKNAPNLMSLLNQFLKLDQPIGDENQLESSLIGVRIAQAKLAAFYLIHKRPDLAKLIYEDMKVEPVERIEKIKQIINVNSNEEYYEITGRGINFFFIPYDRRPALETFFDWFNVHTENYV